MADLIDRYSDRIRGVLSCYDRIVIQGALHPLCFAKGMTGWLYRHKVRIFDYARYAEPLRDRVRANAEQLACQNGVEIEFIRSTHTRKDSLVKETLQQRGSQPGLVCILSAMEACASYRPWHDKKSGKTFLKPNRGKCLHYYFYFVDETLGLCYVRVPTWCPFRLQFYFNGHSVLASKLDQAGIGYQMIENAFVDIEDFDMAQRMADKFDVEMLHDILDYYASLCCPVVDDLELDYRWSIMQLEYATDVVFERQRDLAPLYESVTRTAIHAVKADNVATFLGRKLTAAYNDELGNRFDTRIQGTRIKHQMGPVSIKTYDKFGLILRIETTANDVSFFSHLREVQHRDGTTSLRRAPVRKFIYSLPDLIWILGAANRRYTAFLSELDDPSVGVQRLEKITEPATAAGRKYKGFNFFSTADLALFRVLILGQHAISGFRNIDLRKHLPGLSTSKVSRMLKRLRVHGLIKRVGKTYKYYITKLGRRAVVTGLKLRELVVIPQLADITA